MSNSYPEDYEQVIVEGFEVPKSPDSSYSNEYPGNEDDARDPPAIPPQLQHTLLHCPASRSNSETLPLPRNVNLNHLYIENREAQGQKKKKEQRGSKICGGIRNYSSLPIKICYCCALQTSPKRQ